MLMFTIINSLRTTQLADIDSRFCKRQELCDEHEHLHHGYLLCLLFMNSIRYLHNKVIAVCLVTLDDCRNNKKK